MLMAGWPDKMRAVVLTGHGDLDRLVYHDDWSTPSPGADEVLIRVAACGLNNTDVNTRTAWYSKGVEDATTGGALDGADEDDAAWGGAPITFPRIQGADAVGNVIAVGDGADAELIGKRVMVDGWLRDWDDPMNRDKSSYFGSERDGGFADYTVVHWRNIQPVESDLSSAELATFSTSYVTAENMLNRAAVGAEDVVLITGASGGVGSALIQLANRRGAWTVALCGNEKADAVRAVGPTAVLPREPEDLKGALLEAVGSESVPVVADIVGGAFWPILIDALERGGRYVCSGAIAGPMVELDLRTFYLRDLTLVGATAPPPGVLADLAGYIERREIRPLLAATFPLADLRDAQQAFIDKRHVGNIVVTMD
jgi:NADPH:quinone reductase-like Zn-dependent oxidoreductase